MKRKPRGLRPFLVEIRKQLKSLTREALEEVVVSFARECSPEDRESFRNRLKPRDAYSADAGESPGDPEAGVNEFIRQTLARRGNEDPKLRGGRGFEWNFRAETRERMLNKHFDEAHRLFLAGDRAAACRVYEKLLSMFFLDEEYGNVFGRRSVSAVYKGDIRETCARYFRALYDTVPLDQRAEVLAEAMRSFGLLCPAPPLFQDVMDAAEDPIGDLDEFLPLWISALKERSVEGHRWGWVSLWDELLAEAATIQEGAEGARKMARESGPHRAMAYMRWIEALMEEDRLKDALEAAQEALKNVRIHSRTRAEIADCLARLAAGEGDKALSLQSRREAFCSYPALGRLIRLYREARDEEEAREEMAGAALHLEEITARPGDDLELEDRHQDMVLLRARALLLAGRTREAIALAEKGKPLGWTSGADPQGVVIPSMLVAAAGIPSPHRAFFIYRVWSSYPLPDDAEDEFRSLFLQALKKLPLSLQERESIFALISPMIQARVSAILEGQKRESYRKAAHLVLAQKETLTELGRAEEGDDLLEQASGRYPQATRFQKELRTGTYSELEV